MKLLRSCNTIARVAENQHLLQVAVVGTPNCGKSTLLNALTSCPISAVGKLYHTTQKRIVCVLNRQNTQICLNDTPGLQQSLSSERHSKLKLELNQLSSIPFDTVKSCDVTLAIHDLSDPRHKSSLHPELFRILEFAREHDKPTLLALNKMDVVDKIRQKDRRLKLRGRELMLLKTYLITGGFVGGRKVARRIRDAVDGEEDGLNQWRHFESIFHVSALNGDGVDVIREELVRMAMPGKWLYESNTKSSQTTDELIKDAVRAAFINHLPAEVPFKVKPDINIEEEQDKMRVHLNIECLNKYQSNCFMYFDEQKGALEKTSHFRAIDRELKYRFKAIFSGKEVEFSMYANLFEGVSK